MESEILKIVKEQSRYTDQEAKDIIATQEQQLQNNYKSALKQLGLKKEPEEIPMKSIEITDTKPPDEIKGEIGIDWGDLARKLGL
jgi:hypothetical protein